MKPPGERSVTRIGLVLLALLAPLPWAYGSVHAPSRGAYVLCLSLLFAAAAIWRIRAGGKPALLDGPTALLIAAIAWAATGLVPIPADLLALVSPATWRIAIGNFADAGLDVPVEHPIAIAPHDAAEAWATAAAHVMVFVIAARTLSGRRGARALAAVLAISGALMAILAITQQSLGASRIFWIGLDRDQFYGTFVNGNHAATFLGAGCLSALGLLLRERDPGKKLAWGLCGVIAAIGAMYSLSRGGVLALAAGLAVFLFGAVAVQGSFRKRSRDEVGRFFARNAVPLMLAGLAVFYLSWLGPKEIGRELSSLAKLDLPKDYRARVWGDSTEALRDWPITGSGSGTFAHVYPRYRSFPADVTTEMAESDWVQLAVENGVAGFLLVAAFAGLLLSRFFGAFLRDPLRFSGAHLGLAAALVAIVGHAMVDFPLRIPAIGAFAAAIAGALAGAVHRRRKKAKTAPPVTTASVAKKLRRTGPRPVLLAWVVLPAAATAALGYSHDRPKIAVPRDREEALAVLRDRPSDARSWIRLARLTEDGEASGRLYAIAATLDHGDPAVQRAAALGLARAGDADGAIAILSGNVRLLNESGPQWRARASEMAIDLASQLLWSDPDAAAKALEDADAGPRRALVAADIAAARAEDASGTREAVGAYLAAARESRGALAEVARLRATLLTVNATRTMPAADARTWFDALAAADDPGEVLADLDALVQTSALDAQRIWGGAPRLGVDRFDGGEPRLRETKEVAVGGAHRIEGGAELLELRYESATVLNDLWAAPLALRTSNPRLALSARVKTPGRVGDQLCVRIAGTTQLAFGSAGEPDAAGWRRIVVRGFAKDGPVALDAWCFDTRGRPGPYLLDDIELFLDASP